MSVLERGAARATAASSRYDSGRFSVADPRIPAANDRLTCIIRSLDGTWHRPFTTLEKAALQSLVDPEEQLILDALHSEQGRRKEAAARLGISPRTLRYKLARLREAGVVIP